MAKLHLALQPHCTGPYHLNPQSRIYSPQSNLSPCSSFRESWVGCNFIPKLQFETGDDKQSTQIVTIHFLARSSMRRKLESLPLLGNTGLQGALHRVSSQVICSLLPSTSEQKACFFDS